MTPPRPKARLVYGCIGADRPEAQPYIVEVEGVLVYTCPECQKTLKEFYNPVARE